MINPPFLFPVRNEFVFSHCLGPRYISSYLKTKGFHKVEFIDALMEGFSNVKVYANGYIVGLEIDDIVSRIPSDADLIGISVPFSQLAPVAHDLAERVRSRFPKTLIVMGGVYPSTQPHLALTSEADMIVVGEGEDVLFQIAKGKKPYEIEGVYSKDWFPQNQNYSPTRVIENLDDIPFPDYSIPKIEQYFNFSPRISRDRRTASIITSRACPYNCEFCSIHPVYGHKWRYRSAKNVLEEISYLVDKFGIRRFEFEDDNFTLHRQRTIDILEGIIRLNEKGSNIIWQTPNGIRIDTLNNDIIKLIKRSNCELIVLGLEHGDQEMLQIMNKQLDLNKAFDVIKKLVENEISIIAFFIIVGYPGETRERFLSSMNYIKKIKALGGNIHVFVNIVQPYPGTKLLKRCLEEGYIKDSNFDNFLVRRDLIGTGYNVSITTPDFDKEEVLYRKKKILEFWLSGKDI